MNKILIMGEGGSGTSILAQALIECGLWPGDTRTMYHPDFNNHYEHYYITRAGVRFNNGVRKYAEELDLEWRNWFKKIDEERLYKKVIASVSKILRDTLKYAEQEGKEGVFVKTTINFGSKAFKSLFPVFKKEWKGIKILVTIRHPLEQWRREKFDISEQDFVKMWLSQNQMKKVTADQVVFYPESWTGDHLKKGFKNLGIKWNDNVKSHFSLNNLDPYYIYDIQNFLLNNPKIFKFYQECWKEGLNC